MGKNLYVLPYSHLPEKLPLVPSIVFYMALDMYHAPGWAFGVVGAFMTLAWIGSIVRLVRQQPLPMTGYGESKDD